MTIIHEIIQANMDYPLKVMMILWLEADKDPFFFFFVIYK